MNSTGLKQHFQMQLPENVIKHEQLRDGDELSSSSSSTTTGNATCVLFGDSGYNSSHHSQLTTPGTSQHQHTINGPTLASIEEAVNPPQTPNTKNCFSMNALHLSTPKGLAAEYLMPSPSKKRPASAMLSIENFEITPKKRRSLDTLGLSATPKKPKRRRPSFRNKLYSDSALLFNENIENITFENSAMPAGLDFSPIHGVQPIRSCKKTNVLQEKLSTNSLSSSTPKDYAYKPSFYVETVETVRRSNLLPMSVSPRKKTRILKKIQSFSPRSYSNTSLHQPRRSISGFDKVIEETETTQQSHIPKSNPARKLLSFDSKRFERIISGQTTDEPAKTIKEEDEECPSLATKMRSNRVRFCRQNAVCKDDSAINCSSSSLDDEARETFFRTESFNMLPVIMRDDSFCDSELPGPKAPVVSSVSLELLPLPTVADAQSPPKLGRVKCPKYDVRTERLCTYNRSPKPAKRLARPPCLSPRKFVSTNSSHDSLGGFERFDLLTRLHASKPAMDIIFRYLSGRDLVIMCFVSKRWKSIVAEDQLANKRRLAFVRLRIPMKENWSSVGYVDKGPHLVHQKPKAINCDFHKQYETTRPPMRRCNSDRNKSLGTNSKTVQRSPPVSPSKRRFVENQKIVKRLDAKGQLTTCPRCAKPSIMHLIRSNSPRKLVTLAAQSTNSPPNTSAASRISRNLFQSDSNNGHLVASIATKNAPRIATEQTSSLKTNPFGLQSKFSSLPSEKSSPHKQSPLKNVQYAECSAIGCGFRFCFRCRCALHPERQCYEIDSNASPKEDSRNRRNIAGSRESRKNLRRLV